MSSDILDRLRAYREGAPTIPIHIEEWGLDAFIKPISVSKHASLRKNGNEAKMSASFIIHCLVDENGAPIFKDDAATVAELMSQPSGVIGRVAMQIVDAIQDEAGVDTAKNY